MLVTGAIGYPQPISIHHQHSSSVIGEGQSPPQSSSSSSSLSSSSSSPSILSSSSSLSYMATTTNGATSHPPQPPPPPPPLTSSTATPTFTSSTTTSFSVNSSVSTSAAMQPQSSGTFFESQSTYYPVPPPPANLHEEAASSEMLEPGEGNSNGRCAEDADDALQAGSAQATELLPPNQLLQSSPNSSSISPPLLGQHHQHQHQLSYQQVLMGGSSASMQDLQQQQQQQQQEQIDQATLEQQQQQLLAEYTGVPVTESISRTSLSTRRLCLFTFLLLYASAGAAATATAALAKAQSVDQFYELSKNGIDSLMQSDQPGKGGTSKAGASLVVVSGQKASLTCPLLSLSSNKLLASSSASSLSTAQTVVVKWLKENTALPYDHRHHIQANGSLVITSAQKRLDEGSYFCSLGQTQDGLPVLPDDSLKNSAIVTLRVIDPPRVGPFEFPADLQVGMRARAMCAVSQGDAPFRFSWTQDGRRIESEVPTSESGALFRVQHFRDYSLLTVDTLTLAHAGNITCLVGNDAAKTSQSAMLKVNAPPQWLVEPRDTQVVLHQSARVDCLASGSPKPFTTWKRATGGSPWEYVPIYNSVHYYLHPNGSLSIMAATQAQAGPFVCQSTNGYGADIGKLVHIKVNEPPRFSVASTSQTAQKDQVVRLVCQPEGDRPIRMEWSLLNGTLLNEMLLNLRDNHRAVTSSSDDEENGTWPFEIKEVPLEAVNEETNGIDDNETTGNGDGKGKTQSAVNENSLVSVLAIKRPSRQDSRVYVCKASNDFGWAEMKIRLTVKERPDVPKDFSVLNVTESSAEIRWREPFNGNAVIVNYVVEYRVIDIDPVSSAALPAAPAAAAPSAASAASSASSSLSVSSTTIAIDRVTTNGSLRSTIVSALRPSTFYNIRIAATNSIGQGDFTAWTRLCTEQSAPESPPLEVHATATGPNSVKITWKSPKKSTWNGEISGFYIGYRAANSDTDLYKTVEKGEENGSGGGGGGKFESHITNLHRSTLYEAWVQAFNARGTGPRSELATVRTLADVPPSAPLLRLHSSTTDSITISWSPAAFGSRSSNDLTLYYRPYQPSSEHSAHGGTVLRNAASNSPPNTWRDISILEPNGRHSVSGLECGRAYEFFATAHNSVGKSEPSTPLVARTRGDAPSPPPRGDLLTEVGAHGAVINLLNWKNNDCPISHFSIRYRPKASGSSLQPWSVLAVHHSPRDNFVLRKLSANTAYEIEVTAHSFAGSTQVIHHLFTRNVSTGETFFNKMGFDQKVSAAYPMPSSTSEIGFSDYEILLPVISSLVVVVVIVAVACFLCSRDHHSLFLQPGLHSRQRQPSASSEKQVPFQQQEMSILKELVRSSSVTMDSHADSVMVNGAIQSQEYSCLNGLTGEPASLPNSDHLNHHHLLNSPHHGAKKDMVELQSFYHHHFHHSQQENASKTTRPPTSGNYALPYDVLPISRENSNVAIYGQRPVTAVNAQSQSVPSSQQPSVAEPLYATTKPVASYNHYCQKLDDSQSSDSSSNRNNSSSRANYESLVPIVCLEPRR